MVSTQNFRMRLQLREIVNKIHDIVLDYHRVNIAKIENISDNDFLLMDEYLNMRKQCWRHVEAQSKWFFWGVM